MVQLSVLRDTSKRYSSRLSVKEQRISMSSHFVHQIVVGGWGGGECCCLSDGTVYQNVRVHLMFISGSGLLRFMNICAVFSSLMCGYKSDVVFQMARIT